jgi:hypothetical protein
MGSLFRQLVYLVPSSCIVKLLQTVQNFGKLAATDRNGRITLGLRYSVKYLAYFINAQRGRSNGVISLCLWRILRLCLANKHLAWICT